jgi:hypothetical protein
MRITSVVVAVIAGLTFAVTGCGGAIESEQDQDSIQAAPQGSEQSATEGDVTAMGICPLQWYCDGTARYYSTQSACNTACAPYGYTCYRDYACTGSCICP